MENDYVFKDVHVRPILELALAFNASIAEYLIDFWLTFAQTILTQVLLYIWNTHIFTYDYIPSREPSWKPHVFLVAINHPARIRI